MQPMIFIYQLKNIKETKYLHDKSLDELNAFGKKVEFENYDEVWTKFADPEDITEIDRGTVVPVLEYYCDLLNKETLPEGYSGGNLSIGDVIGICTDKGGAKAFYVDVNGFEELPDFFPEGFEEDVRGKFDYSDDFGDLPGFAPAVGAPQGAYTPTPKHERHFYTSLYINMGDDTDEESVDTKMEQILEKIKAEYPDFAYTIHDAETNDYYN